VVDLVTKSSPATSSNEGGELETPTMMIFLMILALPPGVGRPWTPGRP
jgi:hypothetical protein